MFSWAANPSLSEYVGKHVVAGKACTLWQLRMPSLGPTYKMMERILLD